MCTWLWVRAIAAQQEDVFESQHPHGQPGVVASSRDPSVQEADSRTPEACWLPAQLQSKTLFHGNKVERDRGLQAFHLAVCVHTQQSPPTIMAHPSNSSIQEAEAGELVENLKKVCITE